MTHSSDTPSNCEQNGLSSAYLKSQNGRDGLKPVFGCRTIMNHDDREKVQRWTFP